MAQYQITLDSQTLHQLFMTKSKDSGMSALLESVLNQILQAEATEQPQAEPYKHTCLTRTGLTCYRSWLYDSMSLF